MKLSQLQALSRSDLRPTVEKLVRRQLRNEAKRFAKVSRTMYRAFGAKAHTPQRVSKDQDGTVDAGLTTKIDRVTELLQELLSQSEPGKEWYTVEELAEQTRTKGGMAYSRWRLAEACNQGQIPEARKKGQTEHNSPYKADKSDKRRWLIPLSAIQRILSVGLPPLEN